MMITMSSDIPALILRKGATRRKDALHNSIMAAKIIAEVLKSSLGPRGMDKMLIDNIGDVRITNDGASILDWMYVEHPAAKILVDIAKTQDKNVGDGTKTVVVFAGELLSLAEELISSKIHPMLIIKGYRKAAEKSLQILNEIAEGIDINQIEILKDIAMTSLRSKSLSGYREQLANIAVEAVRLIAEKKGDERIIDLDKVIVVKKRGMGAVDTKLVYGIILEKEVLYPSMPRRIKNCKIALLNCMLKPIKPKRETEIAVRTPEEMKAHLDGITEIAKQIADKIIASGANVVVCTKLIDELVGSTLAKAGILAVDRVSQLNLKLVATASGGRILNDLDDLQMKSLGYAKLVEERKIGEDKLIFIENCKNLNCLSILIRGGTKYVIEEEDSILHDAMSVVADVMKNGKIVAGGGAIEMEIARRIKDYAKSVGGREQFAITAFAKAIEIIPKTLSENAGLDSINILARLRACHEEPDKKWFGIDVFDGKVKNMMELGVLESLNVKAYSIKSAVEAAEAILRIDEFITAGKKETEKAKNKQL